jgi:hypothetical protein
VSNAARFEQSFRDIADAVKLFGRQNPKANIFKLVHDWLHDGKKGKWVLILDNVDDARFLLDAQPDIQGQTGGSENSSSKPLREYLPQSQNGSILITLRSKEAALRLVEPSDIVAVEPMDEIRALALFEKKLGKQDKSQDIAELAAALEYMPLAIAQAAAYISQRAPRYSVQQYLEEFRKSDYRKTSLLDHEGGQLRRDQDAKNSIIVTWQISFDYILQTRRSAADLLSLMSFCDRQGIPEALVRSRAEQRNGQQDQRGRSRDDNREEEEDSELQCSASDEFENDILALRNYSFIFANAGSTTFETHRLVQLATRKWLHTNGQLEKWKQQYIKNLYTVFPTGALENWIECQALFPHAKSVIEQKPVAQSSLREWALILHRAASYIFAKGGYIEAEGLSQKATGTLKREFGQDDVDTLSSMGMLWLAYRYGGRWKEAEELEVQVTETFKRVLGTEHPDTLTSMANLASTYRNQGRWKEAEELQAQELKLCSKVLGKEHPDTLVSMSNLACIWKSQGRDKQAIDMVSECIQLQKRKLGVDHPSTISSLQILKNWQSSAGKDLEWRPVGPTSPSILKETTSNSKRHRLLKKLGIR